MGRLTGWKASRRNRINMFLPAEEYNRRVAERLNPDPHKEARRLAKLNSPPDGRVRMLYQNAERWRKQDKTEQGDPKSLLYAPFEVLHIRPVIMGGRTVYENLWIARRSKNSHGLQDITEEEILHRTMLVAEERKMESI